MSDACYALAHAEYGCGNQVASGRARAIATMGVFPRNSATSGIALPNYLGGTAGQDNVSIAVDLGVSRPTIMRFVEYWKQRTGHLPEELVFDSKLTTYRNLSRLNELGIPFITLRRRDPKMLQEIHTQPASAWRRIELESIARAYRTPRI